MRSVHVVQYLIINQPHSLHVLLRFCSSISCIHRKFQLETMGAPISKERQSDDAVESPPQSSGERCIHVGLSSSHQPRALSSLLYRYMLRWTTPHRMFSRTVLYARRLHCNSHCCSTALSRVSSIPGIISRRNTVRGPSPPPVRKMSSQAKRRFAPLSGSADESAGDDGAQKLRGIVFDMDGTLCRFSCSSSSCFPFLASCTGEPMV